MTRLLVISSLFTAMLVACPGQLPSDASQSGSGSGSGGGGGGQVGEVRITLTPGTAFANAKGKAKYKNRGGEQEFQVEAENIISLQGQMVAVCVNGSRVGGATVNSFGEAELNLNSDLGQSVPAIVSGSQVSVRTGNTCSGAVIVSGTF